MISLANDENKLDFLLQRVPVDELTEYMAKNSLSVDEMYHLLKRCDEQHLDWRTGKSTKSAFDSFGFYSLPDLTDEERTPPEFVVEGMIPTGMTFLSGAPKLRKSFLALQMAAAVATGSDFLGHKTMQCSVAYLDLEGSKSRISTRADRMRLTVPRNVYITNDSGTKISDHQQGLWQSAFRGCMAVCKHTDGKNNGILTNVNQYGILIIQ